MLFPWHLSHYAPLAVPQTLWLPLCRSSYSVHPSRAHFVSHTIHSLPGHFTFPNFSSSLCKWHPICLQSPLCQQLPGCLPRMFSESFTLNPKLTSMSSPLGIKLMTFLLFEPHLPNASLLPHPTEHLVQNIALWNLDPCPAFSLVSWLIIPLPLPVTEGSDPYKTVFPNCNIFFINVLTSCHAHINTTHLSDIFFKFTHFYLLYKRNVPMF